MKFLLRVPPPIVVGVRGRSAAEAEGGGLDGGRGEVGAAPLQGHGHALVVHAAADEESACGTSCSFDTSWATVRADPLQVATALLLFLCTVPFPE